ncbi:hypothetical protein PHISCL_03184 [Aspergillus sclerotialis]|uniref:Ubiquitin 3 binding protein But2 C-terminal domain-containing protein n=1 Tax=Aspergillus sclerotialis TaxID=2070753 RepID=A0A3A2ZMU3_9EURO|nr:hypothetical protein PHISCL_03184 [Aspergillus sclerotialis]
MKYAGIFTAFSLFAAATAASIPMEKREDDKMYPHATFRRWVSTGQLVEDPQDQLLVVRNNNPAEETTAIVTFDFDPSLEGRTCKLMFELWARDTSTGSQTVDVFSTIDPPSSQSMSVAEASKALVMKMTQSRGEHMGRIKVPAPGTAEWIQSYHGMPEFPCPAGQLMGWEFVGVGEDITLQWDIGVTGPTVQVL